MQTKALLVIDVQKDVVANAVKTSTFAQIGEVLKTSEISFTK